MKDKISIFWFRRDLRLSDNKGLHEALTGQYPVLPLFIFDKTILHELDKYDRRVDYFHQALTRMNEVLHQRGSTLKTYFGKPLEVFKDILETYNIHAVYCNRDYEPQAINRDIDIQELLKKRHISFYDFKDQVIFEKNDIVKDDGAPYTVYTPYAKKWRNALQPEHYHTSKASYQHFIRLPSSEIHSLQSIGFDKTDIQFQEPSLEKEIIGNYGKYRDFPAMDRTTHLGIALRFGTISIRTCVAFAVANNDTWLSELIWREFFMQILFHLPNVVTNNFKSQYDFLEWRNNEREFHAWCEGSTGYPIVDAGMKQLNQTGFMHNRVRMITASFLCKHLLIDWRWGESYFAKKLLDYELSSNNGNWQWAAGTGCDAAPYFRIFNPALQRQKFDKDLLYVKTWNPDYEDRLDYKIVDHDMARKRALDAYKKALERG